MERSGIKYMKKLGWSNKEIASESSRHRNTIGRVLKEPVEQKFRTPERPSQVDPYIPLIKSWLQQKIPVKRMLEMAREQEDNPYSGGKTAFYDRISKLRNELKDTVDSMIVGFESLPGEFLQVDWGEAKIRFDKYGPEKRYFFCAQLKYSRWKFVAVRKDMQIETLLRCLLECFEAIEGIPWCLVFDNMKTVTTGRDAQMKPVWNDTYLKFAAEMEFHSEVCWPNSPNQKGSVEKLVGYLKSNFLAGRTFYDDVDLEMQKDEWLSKVNFEVCQANEQIPADLISAEREKFTPLLETSDSYGVHFSLKASCTESLITIDTNKYSAPEEHAGTTLTVRLHKDKVKIFKDQELLAVHDRCFGRKKRLRKPEHLEDTLSRKPRARVMLYREVLCNLSPKMQEFISDICMKNRNGMDEEIIRLYELYREYGREELSAAVDLAVLHGAIGTSYLDSLLKNPDSGIVIPVMSLAGIPAQEELDRNLNFYEMFMS